MLFLCLGLEASGREPPRVTESTLGSRAAPVSTDAAVRQALRETVRKLERDLSAAERLHGPEHPETARILAESVQALWGLEEYAVARPLAERALSIRLKAFGPQSHEAASSFYQIAELRRATGDYAGALRFHRRALAVWEAILGPQSFEAACALHYLGVVRLAIGDLPGARGYLEKALAARETTLGREHELVATTLSALAEVRAREGDGAVAALLLERAQSIWEKALGPMHPFVARTLTGRARLLLDAGDALGAGRLLDRALDIRTRVFGPDHYLVARSLADIAHLEAGPAGESEALYLRALDIQRRSLGSAHPEVAATLAALARLQWESGKPGPALDNALEAEAIARESFRRSARDLADDEALRFEANRTSGLDVALSILGEAGPDRAPGPPRSHVGSQAVGKIVDQVLRSRALVFGDLANARRKLQPGDRPGLREVFASLPAGSLLIVYVRYERIDRSARQSTPEYLAVVLKSRLETPLPVALGPAARIDALVAAWRDEASRDPRLRQGDTGDHAYRSAGNRLRAALWDPLSPLVAGARRVFILPDGAINLVSLATLPAGDDGFLIEDGPAFHYLAAPADLVDRGSAVRGDGVLVMGGVDFDASPSASARRGTGPRDEAPPCPDIADLRFAPLAGSSAEVDEVESLWPRGTDVLRLTGADADESAFKKHAPSRRILHLATHAYYLPGRCGLTGRSGLALAGANGHGDTGETESGEDGILTAEEIASLDLSGVELAVLSACDTGVGQVMDGEGVVGLRGAFNLAGARTLIASLWPVDDGAARIWMRGFYKKRLSGLATVEAAREAGREILRSERAQGRSTHPYFWGSFVAAGDWR